MRRDAVDELRELDRVDTELRERAERLRALDARAAEIRAEAEEIASFREAEHDLRAGLGDAVGDTSAEVERRRQELRAAEVALAGARDEERPAAERARERAADHLAVAIATADRAHAALAELEQTASIVPRRLEELTADAAEVVSGDADLSAPADASPAQLVDWASRVHASVFVTAGTIDQQRERLVREANELGSLLLGEPTYGSTVAQVAARVEAASTE